MKLEIVFHVSIYLMTALAGAMLAFGEGIPFPSGLTVLMSIAALLFCERNQRLRINTFFSNVLGLAALGMGTLEFFGKDEDSKLLAGAHFLSYITWIVLFQKKEVRQYWWLCALSLLQVAIGPLLTMSSGWYGVLLVVYLILAIWTLSVFTLYQGAMEFGAASDAPDLAATKLRAAAHAPPSPANDAISTFRRAFAHNRRSAMHNSIQQDAPGRWIVPRFVFGVFGLSVAGLSLGLGMFLFVPRVWIGTGLQYRGDSDSGTPAVTGFTNDVRLGQLGQILESTNRVMQVGLFKRLTDEPIDIEEFARQHGLEAPLFRGNVLDEYGGSRWNAANRGEYSSILESHPLQPEMIRQEYMLDMRGFDILFAMTPYAMAKFDPYQAVTFNVETDVLHGQGESSESVVYYVYTKPANPGEESARGGRFRNLPRRRAVSSRTLARCRKLPRGLDRLARLARDLTASEKLISDSELSYEARVALTLEAHLRDSGQYLYSLNMAVDDAQIDPVEDFLFNRKRGHCEYFASALALMLRAVDIPSRLVTGFKGADSLGSGQYEVQQRHAHAWVEAFVNGKWTVLDPTPGGRDDTVREVAARAGFLKRARNSISSFWSTYVVALNLNRQQQTLYEPLQGSVASGWGSVRNIMNRMSSILAWIKRAFSSPEQVFTPARGAVGLLILVLAVTAFRAFSRLFNRERRPADRFSRYRRINHFLGWLAARLRGRPPDPARVIVAFYEQFQTLMHAAGLAPRLDQTQREFARHVEQSFAAHLATSGLQSFPTDLAELFYRVRFGDGLLQPTELIEVEQRLAQLAKIVGMAAHGR